MDVFLRDFAQNASIWVLVICLVVLIYALAKGADLLVDRAVNISRHLRVPNVLIGATVVSLGTTLPEAFVSVLAAVDGSPGLAMGNAVGSIICDTGLILGMAACICPLPLDQRIVNRQGRIQIIAGVLLVAICIPYSNIGSIFETGGSFPQWAGWLFLGLLVVYFYWSYRLGRGFQSSVDEFEEKPTGMAVDFAFLFLGVAVVLLSSKGLIVSAEEVAHRAAIPESVIAASLVAFGTSLPELVTVLTSVRKGRADLAVGNVIGADILNVLFVAGAAAAVTPGGLKIGSEFFKSHFIVMLAVLIIFRLGIYFGKTTLKRWVGVLLLIVYALFLLGNYVV